MDKGVFFSKVSARVRVQVINLIRKRPIVNDTYKKDEKIPTKIEAVIDEDVTDKTHLDTKLTNKECHVSFLEQEYNEFILCSAEHTEADVLYERAVKTTIEILYDKGLFDKYDIAKTKTLCGYSS